MVAQLVPTPRTFKWSRHGKHRVAALIKATVDYNRRHGLEPGSVRALSVMAKQRTHTSVMRYAKGQTDDPNTQGCRVLRALAPFIYQARSFSVENDTLSVSHKTPEQEIPDGFEYWKVPGLTYADRWEDFVRIGEDRYWGAEEQRPQKLAALRQILKTAIKEGRFIPNFAEKRDLIELGVWQDEMENDNPLQDCSNIGAVIIKFLRSTNRIKASVWSLQDLANHKIIDSSVTGITEARLQDILNGAAPEEYELIRFQALFESQGFQWTVPMMNAVVRRSCGNSLPPA